MEITLILDLQDHTESSCQKRFFKFSTETTIEQLMRKIKHYLAIDEEYQLLYFKGDQILSLNSTLQRIGLKDEDTIVVKHSSLPTWDAFLKELNTFNNTQYEETKRNNFDMCKEFNRKLKDVRFYSTYPSFADQSNKIMDMFSQYFDKLYGAIVVSIS